VGVGSEMGIQHVGLHRSFMNPMVDEGRVALKTLSGGGQNVGFGRKESSWGSFLSLHSGSLVY
jgi:hypothetical protein